MHDDQDEATGLTISVPQGHSMLSPEALAARVLAESERRDVLVQYYRQHMKEGTDYGRIPIAGKLSKPSLFKPGSEKFVSLMGLRAIFERDTDTWEMAGKPEGMFCYVCHLLDGHDRIVGEGRGVALMQKNQNDPNKAVKMAQKSAMIDAVLRTGGLSDYFSQDLEDMDVKVLTETAHTAPAATFESDYGAPPDCINGHGALQIRTVKATGRAFWGCSAYPACKNTKPAVFQQPQQLPLEEAAPPPDDAPF